MVRRRGLVRSAARTAGRTALVAGTATSVAGRVARRQQQKFAQDAPAAAAPHRAAADGDVVGKLQQLADLKATGALSEKEYSKAKARVLAT